MKRKREFEKALTQKGYKCIAGVDEAGRGPLAGPVVAAACILPQELSIEGIDDSKMLSPARREEIFEQMKKNHRIYYAVGVVEADTIDQINILQATLEAMLIAIEQMPISPDYLLIDGKQVPEIDIPLQGIVRGDSRSESIAAASIIAKVTRDRMMLSYHDKWPEYRFEQHKGYATKEHLLLLEKHGPSPIHRRSFEPVKSIF